MQNAYTVTVERYYTDSAAPCGKCESTVARYDVNAGVIVEVLCIACYHVTKFHAPGMAPKTAAELSALHRAEVR